MRLRLALASGSLLVLALGAAAEAVGGGPSPVALSVSPARVVLVAPASRTIALRNVGTERVVVEVAPKSLDRSAATKRWLLVRPSRLVLRASSQALVTLRARANGVARPGDHQLRVLLVARPAGRSRVSVRIRLGVGVRVRMPGRIIRGLALRGVRVRRHGAGARSARLRCQPRKRQRAARWSVDGDPGPCRPSRLAAPPPRAPRALSGGTRCGTDAVPGPSARARHCGSDGASRRPPAGGRAQVSN